MRVRLALGTRARRQVRRLRSDFRRAPRRDELAARHVAGIREFNRMVCESLGNARLLELEGVAAAVVPLVPERCDPNTAVYDDAHGLARSLGPMAAAYREAGVEAWRVWVPPGDHLARRLLRRAGYRLSDEPLAMSRELDGVRRPPEDALGEWTRDGDPAAMAEIADAAFESGTTFRRAYSNLPRDRAHIHLASVDGKPVSCVATSDTDGNCSVDMAATLPEARGRGLSSALLGHALADAAARGCRTTTLLSSEMGRRVYERLGYAPFGAFEQWEAHSTAVEI